MLKALVGPGAQKIFFLPFSSSLPQLSHAPSFPFVCLYRFPPSEFAISACKRTGLVLRADAPRFCVYFPVFPVATSFHPVD